MKKEDIEKAIYMYTELEIGTVEIGKCFNLSDTTILKTLKNNGIKIRPKVRKIFPENMSDICKLYEEEKWSASDIGKKYNTGAVTILKHLRKNGIEIRDSSECHRIYEINENFFDNIDSEEKAYFLGFLYADGCNQIKGNYVSLDLHPQDTELLEKFAKLIYKDSPSERIKFTDRKRIKNGKIKLQKSAALIINSKHICNMLAEHGCGSAKTFTIRFPKHLSAELYRHFIRGYFDGDGTVGIPNKTSTSFKITSNDDFINEMCKFINNILNLKLSVVKVTYSTVSNLCGSGNRVTLKFLDWLYKDSTIYLQRKFNRYEKLIEVIKEVNKLARAGTRGYSKSSLLKYGGDL